jgi:hypothetical protein
MTRQRSTSASSIRFNGQVYFVPMTNWHLAAWTAARSTRPVVSEQRDNPMDLEAFADSYATHTFAPMLWYTPGAALSDEVYDFLHRLPYIQRIVVLTERRGEGFRNDLVDNQNLQAMLDDLFEQSERARAGVQRGEKQALPSLSREDMGPIFLPLFEDVDQVSASGWTSGDRWLRLHTSLSGKGPAPPYRLPHIAIVVPETPQVACAVVPLAAHVQGTVLYMDPEHTIHEDLIQRLVCAVFGPDAVDEIWLVGKASQLQENLEQEIDQVRRALLSDAAGARGRGPDLPEQIIAALRQQPNRIGQVPTVRIIRGDGHFAVSEQAAVLLLTYRYLDHVLTQAVKHPQGRECFFQFLASQGMRGLFHHCNGILDLADQLRQKNFLALADLHHVY